MPSAYRDGVSYDRISAPLERIGREVLDRLELTGAETVLDAGCGSGRVTQALLGRLPHGHVIGVDGSPDLSALQQLAEQELSSFKRPREYRVLEQLPRNAMGKVVRKDLAR